MSVDLRQDRTVLHFQLTENREFLYSVRNRLLLQLKYFERQLLKCLFDARSAFLEHVHLLVTQRHVMKHDVQVVSVSETLSEIYYIHDPIRLLK